MAPGRSRALSPLSYGSKVIANGASHLRDWMRGRGSNPFMAVLQTAAFPFCRHAGNWHGDAGSNRGPSRSERDALPAELSPNRWRSRWGSNPHASAFVAQRSSIELRDRRWRDVGDSNSCSRALRTGRPDPEVLRLRMTFARKVCQLFGVMREPNDAKFGSRRWDRTSLRRLTAGRPHRDGSTGMVEEFGKRPAAASQLWRGARFCRAEASAKADGGETGSRTRQADLARISCSPLLSP